MIKEADDNIGGLATDSGVEFIPDDGTPASLVLAAAAMKRVKANLKLVSQSTRIAVEVQFTWNAKHRFWT